MTKVEQAITALSYYKGKLNIDKEIELAIKALEERPQGKWIPQTDYDGFTYWKCSECRKKNDFARTKFCFHCGADMRGGRE